MPRAKIGTGAGAFKALGGLSNSILRAVQDMKFSGPSPIQRRAIPVLLGGQNLLAMARTGSGKTAAFLIPIIEKLASHSRVVGARAIILSPTRDLALQTLKFTKQLSKYTDLISVSVVGGESINSQFDSLATNPDILFEQGFAPQLTEICHRLPPIQATGSSDQQGVQRVIQIVLCSATLPLQVTNFVKGVLGPRMLNAEVVRLDADTRLSPDLQCHFFICQSELKFAALLLLIEKILSQNEQIMVFTCTKYHVEYIYNLLQCNHISSTYIHGSLDMQAQKKHLADFDSKHCSVMIATDIAARGLDIPLLDSVINFDFPSRPKVFIHRAGRVARAGRKGTAYSLLVMEELPYFVDLCNFIGRNSSLVKPLIINRQDNSNQENNDNIQQSQNNSDFQVGSFPPLMLSMFADNISTVIQENTHQALEMKSLQRSVSNAFHKYRRERPYATSSGVRGAKEMLHRSANVININEGLKSSMIKEQEDNKDEDGLQLDESDDEDEIELDDENDDQKNMINKEGNKSAVNKEQDKEDINNEIFDEKREWGQGVIGIHPIFMDYVTDPKYSQYQQTPQSIAEQSQIISDIHNFRPQHSFLELSLLKKGVGSNKQGKKKKMNKDINNNKQLEIIHKEDDEQSDDKESDPVDINDDDEDQDDNKNSGMEQEKEQQANKIKRKKEKVDEKSQKRREKEVGYLQAADAFRKMVDSGIEKQRMKNKAERSILSSNIRIGLNDQQSQDSNEDINLSESQNPQKDLKLKQVRTDFRDPNFFIPYESSHSNHTQKSSNKQQSHQPISINQQFSVSQILSTQQGVDDITSFTKDLEDQTIDLVNDDLLNQKRKLIQHSIDSGVGLKTRITADGRNVILPGQKKWDRKKMKFVNADGPKKNALLEQARLQRLGNGDIQNIKKTQQHMDQHQLNKVLNRNSRRGQNVDEGPRYRAKGYTTSLYDEWKKKTKRSIPSVGEIEDEDTVTARSDLQNGGQTKNRMFNHHKKKGRINQNKKGNVKEARKQNQSKSFDKQMNDPQKIKIDKHSAKKAPKPTKQKARNELKPVHEIAKQRARIFDIQDHAKKVQFEKMSRGRGGGMNMSRGRGGMNRGRGRGGGINRGRGGGMNRGRGGMNRGKRRG